MPKQKTLALCIIAKKYDESLQKCLDSVREFVDAIYITYTQDGPPPTTDPKVTISFCTPTTQPEAFFDDGTIKRFDLVRQFNFAQAKEDWILWLDSDDTLKYPEKLRDLVAKGEALTIHGWAFCYKYMWNQKTGEVNRQHWKTQLVKNDGTFEWVGWVHEDLLPKSGAPVVVKSADCVRVHWREDKDSDGSKTRNLRILVEKLKAEGEAPDPRTLFYYGSELIQAGSLDEGVEVLKQYVEVSGWDEERWQAYQYIGGVRKDQEKYEEAIRWYLLSLKERPDFPDAYYSLGLCYQKQELHERALYWFEQGMMKQPPDTNIPTNPAMYTWRPLALVAFSCLMLAKYDKAKVTVGAARKLNPTDTYLKDLEKTILESHRLWETAKAYLTIARFLKDKNQNEKVQNLISSTPVELRDDPLVTRIRNESTPSKTWGPKSIVYFAHGMTEPWSPKNISKGGIGGSEEAIIYLTREFVKQGYEVTVYNWCDNDAGTYDGVTYKNYWEFNPWDKFNILIGWRMAGFLDAKWNAKQVYLDLHDVCSPFDFPPKRLENVTKIFVKSQYHRSLFPEVSDDKFCIAGNGIDLDDFKNGGLSKGESRNPRRVIYTSAPNRGLDILIDLWPKVLEAVPDAELKCFYGWKSFEQIEKNNKQSMKFMARVKAKMEALGIEYPRISQKEMVKEIFKSGIWAYPTFFPEIDCITAKKMQAGGAIPVTTNYAALKENVLEGVKLDGDIYRSDVKEQWLKELIALLLDAQKQNKTRLTLMPAAFEKFGWPNVADLWRRQFLSAQESESD